MGFDYNVATKSIQDSINNWSTRELEKNKLYEGMIKKQSGKSLDPWQQSLALKYMKQNKNGGKVNPPPKGQQDAIPPSAQKAIQAKQNMQNMPSSETDKLFDPVIEVSKDGKFYPRTVTKDDLSRRVLQRKLKGMRLPNNQQKMLEDYIGTNKKVSSIEELSSGEIQKAWDLAKEMNELSADITTSLENTKKFLPEAYKILYPKIKGEEETVKHLMPEEMLLGTTMQAGMPQNPSGMPPIPMAMQAGAPNPAGMPPNPAAAMAQNPNIQANSQMVRVISPDGKLYNLPQQNLQKAIQKGFKVAQ